mgnify:CR=1 FL=1
MTFNVQITHRCDDGARVQRDLVDVADLGKSVTGAEDIGLTLAEAKALLSELQRLVVEKQIERYVAEQRPCPRCGRCRRLKGHRRVQFRTVFGSIELRSPRLYRCRCEQSAERTFSPLGELLGDHVAPELAYLEAKWASRVSFAAATALMREVLPVAPTTNPESVRQHTYRVARRMESELGEEQTMFVDGCQAEREALPPPDGPLTVGIDGGYVRGREGKSRTEGHFEVIAGKSIRFDGSAKCFAHVHKHDRKSKRRLFELMTSQGFQMNQQVTFLSDGGETVRNLQRYLSPEAEHMLDGFHVTMRLTVLRQTAKGLPEHLPAAASGELLRELERLKWLLWHGNLYRALPLIEQIVEELDSADENGSGGEERTVRKLRRRLVELSAYLEANLEFIPNYSDRYLHGERISTGFVESTVNQVVSKRFVKKQQMRWTAEGAHLLPQVRTRELNGDLDETFRHWYPRFRTDDATDQVAVVS